MNISKLKHNNLTLAALKAGVKEYLLASYLAYFPYF